MSKRAPSQQAIEASSLNATCHLLMLNSSHICYIPDIHAYMQSVFNKYHTKFRCMFCYTCFPAESSLKNHLDDLICHSKKHQPTKMVLEEDVFIPHQDLISEMCPEQIIVADCEAMLSKDPTTQNDNSDHHENSDDDIANLEGSTQIVDPAIHKERAPGKINSHIPHAIGLLSLNHNYEYQEYKQLWGLDVTHRFLDTASAMIDNFQTKVKSLRYPNPVLTNQDYFNFINSTHCAYCNIEFATIPKSMKHRHHNWYKAPIYGTPKLLACGKLSCPLIEGNYINSSCARCNWKITNKRRIVNIYFHNFSGYDAPLLISGLLQSKYDSLQDFIILPKGASGYHFVQYKNIRLLDSLSFMPASLSRLVSLLIQKIDTSLHDKTLAFEKILPITVNAIKVSRFNNDVIPHLTGKLSYPYSLPKKISDFDDINYFPSQDQFRDELNETDISASDYARAKLIFEKAGCHNLRDLCDLYLMLDVAFLGDTLSDFSKEIFKGFGIHITNFISGPSLSMRAGLKASKTNIECLSKVSIYEIFQNSIRGGFCSVNKRHARANHSDMGSDYDPNIQASMLMFIDFNNLYGECLTQPMPFADFCYCDHSTVSRYESNPQLLLGLDPEGPKGYFITCDFEIPEALARQTDCMPLGIINTKKIVCSPYMRSVGGDQASHRKLIAGHFSLQRYSFHYKMLQFYISLGVIVTKIHSMIEFSQKPLFYNFVHHCASERKKAVESSNEVLKFIFKTIPNQLYGKTLQNDFNYDCKTMLVPNGEHYRKLCSSFRFKSRRWIIKDQIALVTMSKPKIKVRTPIFIGATVLQLAKLKNLSFDIQVVKPSCRVFNSTYPIRSDDTELIIQSREYIDYIYLVYTDTDSLLYFIALTEKGRLKSYDWLLKNTFFHKYLDRSNFEVLSKDSICDPCQLGYLKSEVKDQILVEIIALAPKCYSIESRSRLDLNLTHSKSAVKGCPTRVAKVSYNHQVFHDMIFKDDFKAPLAKSNHIRRDICGGVNTVHVIKSCLSTIENKRWWLSINESRGYFHPDIPIHLYKPNDIIADVGGIIKDSLPTLMLEPYHNYHILAILTHSTIAITKCQVKILII